MLGSGRKEDRTLRNRDTIEQIITKLREAEVALSKGQPVMQVYRTLEITDPGCSSRFPHFIRAHAFKAVIRTYGKIVGRACGKAAHSSRR